MPPLRKSPEGRASSSAGGGNGGAATGGKVTKAKVYYDSSTVSTPGAGRGSSSCSGGGATPGGGKSRRRKRPSTSGPMEVAPAGNGLCPRHDPRRDSASASGGGGGCGLGDYVLPFVNVPMGNLKARLKVALANHPEGIPRRSLLYCLNDAAEQVRHWLLKLP